MPNAGVRKALNKGNRRIAAPKPLDPGLDLEAPAAGVFVSSSAAVGMLSGVS